MRKTIIEKREMTKTFERIERDEFIYFFDKRHELIFNEKLCISQFKCKGLYYFLKIRV